MGILPWIIGGIVAMAVVRVAIGLLVALLLPKPSQPGGAVRRTAHENLAGLHVVGDGDSDTAVFLLDEARARYDRGLAGSVALEGKASALLSVVAGASGAIGVFGLTKEGKTIAAAPLTIVAVGFALAALAAALYLLRPKRLNPPDPDEFLSGPVVSEDNRAKVALTLARRYVTDQHEYAYRIRFDPWFLLLAYVCVVAAALFVLASAATTTPPSTSSAAKPSPAPAAARKIPSRTQLPKTH